MLNQSLVSDVSTERPELSNNAAMLDESQIKISNVLLLEKQSEKFYYFLFVNHKSGDKIGQKYLSLAKKTVIFKYPDQQKVAFIQVFDLFDPMAVSQGMRKTKESAEKSQIDNLTKTRIIVCGGDGTIQWVCTSALKAGINLNQTPIGIIPVGTGNDFSRSLGWGYKSTYFSLNRIGKLYSLVKQWNNAYEDFYDTWDCEITVYPKSGCFYDIKNQQQRKIKEKVFKKSFTNYIGIGLDARIVYTVEKSRGRNAFFTKILYSVVGTINFCRHLRPIDEYIAGFYQLNSDDRHLSNNSEEQTLMIKEKQPENGQQSKDIGQQIKDIECEQTAHDSKIQEKKDSFEIQRSLDDQFEVVKGYRGLVCLNCTSYMSGIHGIWNNSKKQNNKSYQPQKTNDGMIQFIAFKNQLSLALQRITRNGVKVSQGRGPYLINFKQPKKSSREQTFLEIDGQSIKVINIQSIKITKSNKYDSSRIRVIVRKTD